MSWRDELTVLRNALARFYPRREDGMRMADESGLDGGHIDFQDAAIKNWHAILTEAMKVHKVQAIIDAALQEYPDSEELQLALDQASTFVVTPQSASEAIQGACRDLSIGIATALSQGLPAGVAITRSRADSNIELFLASDAKWCVFLGQSGVGKSTVMAYTALRLMDAGWIVLLVRARRFTLDEVARSLAARIDTLPDDTHWYRLLIEPWTSHHPQGFVLMIDGLDEQNRDVVEVELTKLSDELEASPQARVKVIVSSGEVAWEDLQWGLPFVGTYTSNTSSDRIHAIQIDDFDDGELNEGLVAIGATEYLSATWVGGRIDPRVDTVRELLRHPATFNVFAEAFQAGVLDAGIDLTWAELLQRFVNLVVRRVSRQCRVAPATLRGYLIRMASLVHESGSPDFRVDIEAVRAELPGLAVDVTDPSVSPCASLLDRGLLEASDGLGRTRYLGFHQRNVGSYFLSFALEEQAQGSVRDELQNLIAEWLGGVYDYPPIVDAIIAWAHRLDPDDPMQAALVSALITNPSMRLEVVFRIMPPSSAQAILQAIGTAGEDQHLDPHRVALLALPPSPAVLRAFQTGLHSSDLRIMRLSIRAIGSHRDAGSVPALIRLLSHGDEEIRRLTVRALGLIGPASVARLLEIVGNRDQPLDLRVQSVIALRATRYRAPEIYETLSACLNEEGEGSADLHRNVLLAAAAMRLSELTPQAINALASPDPLTSLAAAKLLTEVQNLSAESSLLDAIRNWSSRDVNDFERYSIIRQVIMALYRLQGSEISDEVFQFLRECLRTDEPLSRTEVAWICGSMPVPQAKVLMLEHLILGLKNRLLDSPLWRCFNVVANSWEIESLQAIAEASEHLEQLDADVARIIVDALIESLYLESDHPLSEVNTQQDALRVLAKCSLNHLVSELARMLPGAEWPIDQEICDILWILGDRQAEPTLLAILADRSPEAEGLTRRRQDGPLYALATCGTTRSADAILEFLRGAGRRDIEINFPERVLVPMMRHGVVTTTQLANILRDENASQEGRIACLLAIAHIDAQRHKNDFFGVLKQDVGEILLGYAAGALGLAYDSSAVPILEHLLNDSDSAFVAVRAAGALARLSPATAARLIEDALARYADEREAGDLAISLALLKDQRSIPFLLEALNRATNPSARNQIIQALGEFLPNEDVRRTIVELVSNGSGGWMDRGQQVPAIHALARHEPDYLLTHATEVYDLGGLEPSSKQALCHWIGRTGSGSAWNEEHLISLLERLVLDQDEWVREQAAQAMVRLRLDTCQSIFERLRRSDDSRTVACAIRTLGSWSQDETLIDRYRSSVDPHIRDAADHSSQQMRKRRHLQAAIDNLGSNVGQVRLAAFYVLEEHGDESTIWQLQDKYQDGIMTAVFVDSIQHSINRRRRNEHRKLGNFDLENSGEAETIRFD